MIPMMAAIYGHKDEASAYVVDDYPYGFKLRCKIRFWLEHKEGFGWRFVSQTTNPKKGDRWNKPKASTYASVGACMFLDENGHVTWTGVSHYSSLEDLKRFAERFPGADLTQVNNLIALLSGRNGKQTSSG
jgi:hypothetical protein